MTPRNFPRMTRAAVLLLLPLLLSSCGLSQRVGNGASAVAGAVFYRKIDTLHLKLVSRAALNNNEGGEALPTVVRVYQLKDRKTFDAARYATLLKQDNTALAADLLDRQVVQVMPGAEAPVAVPMQEGAQYVAVVALFMAPDIANNTWRVVLERRDLDDSKDRIIELNDNRLQLRKSE
ncbi:type VI secretion system lipoprotein TssJ [Rahnella selenatireducens]|uniref:type VI secretion system lipoprotein TssJ n=1 Tax=Rahnella selenatireducens TaxID=3389797 RepID=UPI00396809F9